MKSIFTILFLILSLEGFSCDGCNVSTGIVNNDPVNYVSVKYRGSFFEGEEIPFFRHSGHGGDFYEGYFNIDILGKYFFYKNLYAQGVMSYQMVNLQGESLNEKVNGIADPIVMLGYQDVEVFENWQLNYNVFAGADLGIGKYDLNPGIEYSSGSKSYDALVGFELMGRFDKLGIATRGNLKHNFENPDEYQFGQVINSAATFIYYHEKENLMYIPYAGVSYEWNKQDKNESLYLINSSSEILFFDLGINFLFKERLLIGGKYQYGVYQEAPGWKDLQTSGFECELSYIFGT